VLQGGSKVRLHPLIHGILIMCIPELGWCASNEGKLRVPLQAEQLEGDSSGAEGIQEEQVGSHHNGGDGTTILWMER